MPRVEFRPPTPADVDWVAQHIRAADLAECTAVGRPDMHAVLTEAVKGSVLSWCATVDGEPAFLAGAAPLFGLLGGVAAPWLLGTDLAPRHARALMRHYQRYIAQMLDVFPHLLNFVHAENKVSIAWLRRMGFELDAAAPFGPKGSLFHRFELHRHHV